MSKETIIEVDGQKYFATYLGKGNFSRVYKVGNRVVYYTKGDCAKEVISLFVNARMTHLPEVIKHEDLRGRLIYYQVFSSPYYRNVTKKDRSAYELMRRIINIHKKWWYEEKGYQYQAYGRVKTNYYVMQRFVDESINKLPHSVIKALQETLDLAGNCGQHIGWDFHKGNFGVNDYGTLIFRDIFYVLN